MRARRGLDYYRQEDVEDYVVDRLGEIADGEDPDTLEGPAQTDVLALQGDEKGIVLQDLECAEEFVDDIVVEVGDEPAGA